MIKITLRIISNKIIKQEAKNSKKFKVTINMWELMKIV